jgi:apolipoprotein N-acyltransferase
MFCPDCKTEYRLGFTQCSDCHVTLVDELEDEAPIVTQTPFIRRVVLREWGLAMLAAALSAFAYYISTGLGEIWPLVWLAPVPILILAFSGSWWPAFAAAVAAYVFGSFNLPYRAWGMGVATVLLMLLAFYALPFAGCVLASRYAVRRTRPVWAILVFPTFWTAYAFISSVISPNGTALDIAYSQVDFLAMVQLASVTGIWGITFLLTLIPSAIAVAWHKRTVSVLVIAAAVTAVAVAYGVVRIHSARPEAMIRVGLSASDKDIAPESGKKTAVTVAQKYAARVSRMAQEGAAVIVLPEKFIGVTPEYSDEVIGILRDAARANQVTLIAGLNRFEINPRRNVAVVIGSDGEVLAEYEKRHLVPVFEAGYRVGATPRLFSAGETTWGVAICKDMDFPGWSREYGQRGVRIMAVPAWDFGADARLHSRMTVARGIENGFVVARAANGGFVTFSDAYGRILAEDVSSKMPEAMLVENISVGPGQTVYTSFGDWFGWLCVAAAITLFLHIRRTAHQT